MNFSVTADVLAAAGGRALGSIISKFRNFRNVGYNTFTKLFECSVSPVIEYASEIWGYKKSVSCERVQQRAIRYYLGVHPKAPLLAICGDMGWKNPQQSRQRKIIQYWNRLLNMSDDRLTKKLFLYDKTVCKDNWSSEVKALCEQLGFTDDFNESREINVDTFSCKLMTYFDQDWKHNLTTKPKLRTYVTFKENYCLEDYVKYCLSRKKRSLLAQLRIGILPIALETGRFKGIDVNMRYCKCCLDNVVENEIHLLCKCPLYADQRLKLYQEISDKYQPFATKSDDDKFVHLMKNEWKLTSNFLDIVWSLRTQKLYSNNNLQK